MQTRRWWAAAALLLALPVAVGMRGGGEGDESGAPQDPRVAELIEQLADEDFERREAAGDERADEQGGHGEDARRGRAHADPDHGAERCDETAACDPSDGCKAHEDRERAPLPRDPRDEADRCVQPAGRQRLAPAS